MFQLVSLGQSVSDHPDIIQAHTDKTEWWHLWSNPSFMEVGRVFLVTDPLVSFAT